MEERKPNHKLTLIMRKSCSLSGVVDVVSFDEQEVVLETDMGAMIICGEDLSVTNLSVDSGDVSLTGKIDSIKYTDASMKRSGESLWKRLWK